AFVEEVKKTGNAHILWVLGQTQTMVCLILGDADAAARWHAFSAEYVVMGNGTLPVPDYHLADSLILARKWDCAPQAQRAEIAAELADRQAKLEGFASVCPANFGHKYKLASAEIARVRGEPIETVLGLYREAVSAAGDDFLHLRALAYELEADFWT